MLRLCLLAVVAASAHALCGDGDMGPMGPVSKAEFETTIADVRSHFLDAAAEGKAMTEAAGAANAALKNGDVTPWENIEHTTEANVNSLMDFFSQAEYKVWNMAHRLYNSGGDFKNYGKCSAVAKFVKYAKQASSTGNVTFVSDEQTQRAAKAMEKDLECMSNHLAGAKSLPDLTQAAFDGMTMGDAFDIVAETYKSMFRGKFMAMRWYDAALELDAAFNEYYGLARRAQEKRLINKLMGLLRRELH